MEMTPLENWISRKTGIPGRPDQTRLRDYQFCALRETLRHVMANSRFYKERLRGFSPDSIQSMADVTSLPFTYPDDIAARGTDFLCVSPRDIGRVVTLSTSGTTGNPKRIYFTEEDQELTIDFFHHGMTTFTDASDRVMIFMPGNTEGSVGDLLTKGLARFGCQAIVYGPIKDYEDAMNTLLSEKITSLVGIPSQILTLSRYGCKGQIKLKSVLLSADYVPNAASKSIHEAWNADVYGHYGMTEMGLGGGVECKAQNGYHLREADLLFEIVDPLTGLQVPNGEYGEVVFSTLTRRGMPLIRYRTGDRSRFLTAPCPCGTVLRRLDRVSGRLSEAVQLPDGRPLSITQLDEIILAEPGISVYKAELIEKDGFDVLTITVKCADVSCDTDNLMLKLEPLLGGLKLAMTMGDVDFFTTGTSKRCIIDKRKLL
jgi:phenylacetate-coenzyme A ligase PaaK-like adenylate-forming protein